MRLLKLFPVLLLLVSLAGCAGYRLGPTNGTESGTRSVQVLPFVNESAEPGLADEVTTAVRKSVQRDGTFKLASRSEADLIVSGVLSDFRRRELSLSRNDLRTVSDYQVAVTAKVTIRERATGKVVSERTITGGALLRVGDDLVSSERQALPQIARDLARQITGQLVDGSW
jgi:hypothetical protein